MGQEWDKFGNNTGVNDHLNLVIAAVSQVAQCPDCIDQDLEKQADVSNLKYF